MSECIISNEIQHLVSTLFCTEKSCSFVSMLVLLLLHKYFQLLSGSFERKMRECTKQNTGGRVVIKFRRALLTPAKCQHLFAKCPTVL